VFLKITGLTKKYDTNDQSVPPALNDVTFEVPVGTFLTLLGPSGCGKSTLLNMIAGLDQPTSGRIDIAGRTVFDSSRKVFLPPVDRNISMVFQSYAIWPHMTVRENVEFPLKYGINGKKMSNAERARVVDHALEKVRLSAFADRPAPLLSGGQQQRVSLARALAQRPAIILLDEPLSNLDAHLRENMQKEIRSIVSEEGITAVYVTHDQKEALSMSDIMVVLKEGVVQQIGTPQAVYYRPENRFVAQFMGWPNLIDAHVLHVDTDRDVIIADSALGRIQIKRMDRADNLAPGKRLNVVLKQEDLRIVPPEGCHPDDNYFSLPLVRQVFLGDRLEVMCQLKEQVISIYTSARQWQNGETVGFACSANQLHYFCEA
jgi:iron(III) transport system ATP-binding protein